MADHTQAQNEGGYGLPEVFAALRRDLLSAQKRLTSRQEKPLLNVSEAEVEIAFTVQQSKAGRGGVVLKVFGVGFEAGGEKGKSSSVVHRLLVKLAPPKDEEIPGLGEVQ